MTLRCPALSVLLLVLLTFAHTQCLADREIVFSAQFYKWSNKYYRGSYMGKPERTLDDVGSRHLYRIDTDGRRKTQITFGAHYDWSPLWSPNGRKIAFMRSDTNYSHFKLCLINATGGSLDVLLRIPEAQEDLQHISWSPDGRRIALCPGNYGLNSRGIIYDLKTRSIRRFDSINDCAWSPDSRSAYITRKRDNGIYSGRIYTFADLAEGSKRPPQRVRRLSTRIRCPIWLDERIVVGDDGTSRYNNEDRERIELLDTTTGRSKFVELRDPKRNTEEVIGDVFDDDGRWITIPGTRHELLFESYHHMSDGTHYECYRVNVQTGACRWVGHGLVAGVSPTGQEALLAGAEWIGPYKRGGQRCGALQLVNLKTGAKKNLTTQLVSIEGGDWRRSTSQKELLSHCRAFYKSAGKEKRGGEFLRRIPKSELSASLEKVIRARHPESMAYASSAFTLAYFGIDVQKNTRRMLYCVDLHHYQKPYQYLENGVESYAPIAKAYIALYRKYRLNELKFIMEAETDGALGEYVEFMIAHLFRSFPEDVLLAAARFRDVARPQNSTRSVFRHFTGLKRLADALAWGGADHLVSSARWGIQKYRNLVAQIHHLEQSSNREIAANAKRLMRELRRAIKEI